MKDTTEDIHRLVLRAFWIATCCLVALAAGLGMLLDRALAAPEAARGLPAETLPPARAAALPAPAPRAVAEPARGRVPIRTAGPGHGACRPGVDLGPLFAAIAAVESDNGRRPVGDGGRSRGLYHIGRAYWKEATRHGGVRWNYSTRVWSRPHCRQVMIWYWRRWCPEALHRADLATLARTHNGGPGGPRKRPTLRYWRKVQRAMAARARPERR